MDKIKIIPLTNKEIDCLPFPDTARKLGGIMVLEGPAIDEKELLRLRRLFRIGTSNLSIVRKD